MKSKSTNLFIPIWRNSVKKQFQSEFIYNRSYEDANRWNVIHICSTWNGYFFKNTYQIISIYTFTRLIVTTTIKKNRVVINIEEKSTYLFQHFYCFRISYSSFNIRSYFEQINRVIAKVIESSLNNDQSKYIVQQNFHSSIAFLCSVF